MRGKLYGVGVGPGDPELMTLKALRIIRESDVIVLPGAVPEETLAYQIVLGAFPNLPEKELLAVEMPMTKDAAQLAESHERGAAAVAACLDAGKQAAFLTLGDPTVYSTYLYIHKRVVQAGYEAEIISGIPSFCAAAARLNIGLVEKAQPLHVLPASYPISEALPLSGTKVLMKSGKKIKEVKETLSALDAQVYMVENCGMPEEKIYRSAEEIPEDAGYYSLFIVKEKK